MADAQKPAGADADAEGQSKPGAKDKLLRELTAKLEESKALQEQADRLAQSMSVFKTAAV